MNISVDSSSVKEELSLAKTSSIFPPQDSRILRIERIARRLFGVANCIVSFGQVSTRFAKGERSMAALEAAFCDSLGFSDDPVVIRDTRADEKTSANSWVIGPPYIRFYASQPLMENNVVVGAIFLIDYASRQYQEEDAFLLNDLAGLVEHELVFNTLQTAHDELARQNRTLKRESMIDPTFGTWNRSAIVRSLELEVVRCKSAGKPLSLALVSVDDYVELKNECGLHVSECILIKMVSRMRSCIRPFDALGRYGMEEFLVVLPGTSHVVIQAITERIRTAIFSHPETVNGQLRNVTVSIGTVSTDIFPEINSEQLMDRVEGALHSAKKAGSNRVIHAMPA